MRQRIGGWIIPFSFLLIIVAPLNEVDAADRLPLRETVAWQVALDATLFSPGVIDGVIGPKTRRAIREYQEWAGLPVTGQPDAATRQRLGVDPSRATREYRITANDPSQVGPWPKTWQEKARVKRLGYKSLAALVAERGHCSIALLTRLNPGKDLTKLRAGDVLIIPNVTSEAPSERAAARLLVNLADKTIQPLDRGGRPLGLFHCSIAKDKAKRPAGRCTVKVVAPNPVYVFDPKMWPEVRGVDRKLVIPPGPRNPVGLCWIGLSLPGYGIHGTPEPEMIGRTGSHGCFRLTNWDALRLATLVRPGTPVEFTHATADASRSSRAALVPVSR
jgi:hypothetical protein